MPVDPDKCAHEFHYWPALNEKGWKCCICDHQPGEPPGYDPKLDREYTYRKVYGILDTMHEAELLHVSNGTHGEVICETVSELCRKTGRYDQHSIMAWILEREGDAHAKYWRVVGEGIMAGKDPRSRCPCGALANSWGGDRGPRCGEHWQITRDDDVPRRVGDLASRRHRR